MSLIRVRGPWRMLKWTAVEVSEICLGVKETLGSRYPFVARRSLMYSVAFQRFFWLTGLPIVRSSERCLKASSMFDCVSALILS